MSKFVVLGLLGIGGVLMVTGHAEARWRRSCCGAAMVCVAPTCAMSNCGSAAFGTSAYGSTGCLACSSDPGTAPAMATNGNANVSVAQNPNGSSYQSFSYEPGTTSSATTTTAAPVYSAPAPAYRGTTQRSGGYSEYNSVLRGDRKFHGLGK